MQVSITKNIKKGAKTGTWKTKEYREPDRTCGPKISSAFEQAERKEQIHPSGSPKIPKEKVSKQKVRKPSKGLGIVVYVD